MAQAREKVTSSIVESVPIASIRVGTRRRQKIGPIAALATSIQERGLIHPIIIDESRILVAGQRRLEACKRLGWKKIPARHVGSLSDDEMRALELDENVQRLDLDSYEASKQRLREIEAAIEEARVAESATQPNRAKRGDAAASRALGTSRANIRDTRRHVETADEYPVFQRPAWKKSKVLEAREALEEIGEKHRETVVGIISEPGVPPQTAVNILSNFAKKTTTEQAEIGKLYKSDDPDKVNLAKTRAAKLPPAPPGYQSRVGLLHTKLKAEIGLVPSKYRAEMENAAKALRRVLDQMEADYQALKAKEIRK